jgi:hypothetical protein
MPVLLPPPEDLPRIHATKRLPTKHGPTESTQALITLDDPALLSALPETHLSPAYHRNCEGVFMAPDDLPIDSPAEDSTKSPGTKPPLQKHDRSRIGPEAEVRGGAEEPEDEPLEQVKRRERPKP